MGQKQCKNQCGVMSCHCDCRPATKACTRRIESGNCSPNKDQAQKLLDFGERKGGLAEAMIGNWIALSRVAY